MLKHIKPRDIVEFLLFAVGFVALVTLAAFLESAPLSLSLWIAVALGVVLWIIWGILVIREREKEARKPRLKIMRNGTWEDVMGLDDVLPGAMIRPIDTALRTTPMIFDQEEYKEKA